MKRSSLSQSDSPTGKKNAVASCGKRKNAVVSYGSVKGFTDDFLTGKKIAVASASASGTKNKAVASYGLMKGSTDSSTEKKKAVASQVLVTGAKDFDKSKDGNSDEDPPEEMSNKTAHKNKRIRKNIPRNPFRCPDMNAKEWSKKEEEDYGKWLFYEKGIRGLTREEEAYLHIWSE